ncbi:MAG: hypothetical protein KGJ23_13195 [Euryarchaeota archaeon]|nr:hypothetical protein [Euryarchaeota archaeon]MDE1837555.1 hypothetical protein [Euryarchaeota archaeon]MDE1880036.1 hypothetical protein [Euryarchaeota archaeon]MDE2046135.1 hypothetical protein [Thermoplasmata archaeon]
MDPTPAAIAVSLWLLAAALAFLGIRGVREYLARRVWVQLMWAAGLVLASLAMVVEAVVYDGVVTVPLLQAYIFLSAALVGVLSLGATRVLRSPRLERGYSLFIWAATAVVGVISFVVPVSPSQMVSPRGLGGIISGSPPLSLILASTVITGPATVVLLASAIVGLRRSRKWQTLLLIAGALVLGAGGTLYIASFPVFLYYAEFIGIILLFFGIISLPKVAAPAAAPAPTT